jgi:hypothetical protein
MGIYGKVATILISIAVILWAAYMKIPAAVEGFFQTDCSKYTDCKTCADVGGCVWCPGANKCSAQDRTGFPTDSACNKSNFVTFSDRCVAPQAPGIPSESGRTGAPLPPVPTRACNCPSTTKVVEDVMKVLDPTIKRTVSAELQTYGITMKEGFQSQTRMIAETALGSVQDQVRAITRRSAEARSLGPAPAPSSSA